MGFIGGPIDFFKLRLGVEIITVIPPTLSRSIVLEVI